MRRPGKAICTALVALVAAAAPAAPASSVAAKPVKPSAAAATQSLGLDLLREMPPGNLVVSPNSVATALAMAGTGARGRTAVEMAETLHLVKPARFGALGTLQGRIAAEQAASAAGDPEAPTLNLANGLFVQQGLALNPAFTPGLEQGFGASPLPVDFANDLPAALAAINGWVSERTAGIIPQLFGSLPEETRLVLANAVYFKGKWQHRFDVADTWMAPFHSRRGSAPVEFMHQTENLSYAAGKGYQAVELPYRASNHSMLLLLPRDQKLGTFLNRIDARSFGRIVGDLSPWQVDLSLPRFHLKTHEQLSSALASLGMPTAFSDAANFSGITENSPLKIAEVVHAADIELDEAGTVAAAATGIVSVPVSAPAPLPRARFNANRPFLFFLRDRTTGALLFAGRVVDPASTAG